ncbi:MAG TPA: hypothetical protein VFU15_16525 [Bacteroidia bacterium]|nr:hypothetical protein [Bacteroidia bacterium]
MKKFILFLPLAFLAFSCKKEVSAAPWPSLNGTWEMKSSEYDVYRDAQLSDHPFLPAAEGQNVYDFHPGNTFTQRSTAFPAVNGRYIFRNDSLLLFSDTSSVATQSFRLVFSSAQRFSLISAQDSATVMHESFSADTPDSLQLNFERLQ